MTVTWTPQLGFIKPNFNHRNWDADERRNFELLEEAIGGITAVVLTGNHTLEISDGQKSQGRNAVIEFSGTLSADAIITMPAVEKVWILLNATNKILTFDSGGDTVTLGPSTYGLIYGTDSPNLRKVFELVTTEEEEAELPTLALVLNDKIMQESFDSLDKTLWTGFNATGSDVDATVTADDGGDLPSAYGGNFLRIAGRGGFYYRPLPFNPDALYKVSGRLRQQTQGTADRTVYVGLLGFAADKTTVVDVQGDTLTDPDNMHMFAVRRRILETAEEFVYLEGYFRGSFPGAVEPGPNNNIGEPGVMHEDVRYIAPAFVVNWNSSDGICDIDSIELEIVSPINEIQGYIGLTESRKTDVQGFGLAQSQLGLQRNSQAIADDVVLLDDPSEPLGRTVQDLNPSGGQRIVSLPTSLVQPISFLITCAGANHSLLVRAGGDSENLVARLESGEYVWVQSLSLTPTSLLNWRVMSRSPQSREFTSGSGIFRVPMGVSNILVTEIAGGGGGGGSASALNVLGAGGGGGGSFRESFLLEVSPGEVLSWSVGSGGTGGVSPDNAGAAGGASVFGAISQPGGQGGFPTRFDLGGDGGVGGRSAFHDAGGTGGRAGDAANTAGEAGGTSLYASGGAGGAQQAGASSGGGGGASKGLGGAGGIGAAEGKDATIQEGGGGGGSGGAGLDSGGNGAAGYIRIRF